VPSLQRSQYGKNNRRKLTMKLSGIILIIIIALAALYFFKPDMFNQYVKEPVTKFYNTITKTPTIIKPNNTPTDIASISPEIIGKPYKAYSCTKDLDCEESYPKDADRIVCNVATGECEKI
jgi:hypothetical protein